jgi:putative MFS transporter
VVGLAFRALPESPRWLFAAARYDEAAQVCSRFLRHAGLEPVRFDALGPVRKDEAGQSRGFGAQHPYRGRMLLLCALYFLGPWATIGFPLLSGAVLAQKGFQLSDSLLYLGAAMLGPSLGVLLGMTFIDRVERRTTLALCAIVMAAAGLAFAASGAPLPLMAAGIAFNLVGSIYIAALSIYGAELFPTALRATASSAAWAVNRVTSALVPLALLPLLKSAGALAMLGVIAAALCASAMLVLAFGQRGLSGKPVG